MNSIKQLSAEDLFLLLTDPEKKKSYMNLELIQFLTKDLVNGDRDFFFHDLPYQEIKEFVENIGHEILSKFDKNEKEFLRWEHVGSTSIPDMPGTCIPDACLIYDQFPPSEKVINALHESSFYFWQTASHMDDNDLWFLRLITEEGFLKGSFMTVHLVDSNSVSTKCLLDVRDKCRNDPLTFNEYKADKLKARLTGDGFRDYKNKKFEGPFLASIRKKLGF